MANINKIRLSGTTYSIEDENASKTVELTQAQYDALQTKDPNTFYIITDAEPVDMSDYYTKSETSGATEISTALASKADTATTYTKTEVDNAITAATSAKQDQLVSGTNIKSINGESLLGEGNITIEGGGGGKAVSAGTNISITTGETADTINCTLPITANTGNKNVTVGYDLNVREEGETSIGKFNINRYNKATTHSENTIFTVGNGGNNTLRHNALEIRKNGDLYFADTSNDGQSYYEKPMVRLQDMYGELGNKLETSAITSSVTSASTDSQVPSAKAVYDALQESGGGTVDTELDSTSENPVQNKVIYQKFDEVEEVTAAALNDLNDKIGDINTLLEGI